MIIINRVIILRYYSNVDRCVCMRGCISSASHMYVYKYTPSFIEWIVKKIKQKRVFIVFWVFVCGQMHNEQYVWPSFYRYELILSISSASSASNKWIFFWKCRSMV